MPSPSEGNTNGNFSELVIPEPSSSKEILELTENLPLVPEQTDKVKALLVKYNDIFAGDLKPLRTTDMVKHSIETGETRPIR